MMLLSLLESGTSIAGEPNADQDSVAESSGDGQGAVTNRRECLLGPFHNPRDGDQVDCHENNGEKENKSDNRNRGDSGA